MSSHVKGGGAFAGKLRQAAQKLASGKSLKVGFLADATYPDATPVATVAAANEFGKVTAEDGGAYYQPPRPFFRNMIAENQPSWGADAAALLKTTGGDMKPALAQLGERLKGQLQASIGELETPELADSTKKRKGFDKPLVESGYMQNSVDYAVDGGDE